MTNLNTDASNKLDPRLKNLEREKALPFLDDPNFKSLNEPLKKRCVALLNAIMIEGRPEKVAGNCDALFGIRALNQNREPSVSDEVPSAPSSSNN